MSQPVLAVKLQAGYGTQPTLKDLSLEVYPGERIGLLGPSGSGKSTLLLALLGLLPRRGGWARGEVWIEDKNILAVSNREARKLRGRAFALVPQSPLSALNPALSLQTHFEQCWKAHRPTDKRAMQARVQQLLTRVQLPHDAAFLKRKPGQISAGQAQRCVLAMALLHRPPVIIADEPTSSLDPSSQTEVIDLLREVTQEEDAALLFVSHDLLSVLRLCSTVAVLSEGRLAEVLPTTDIAHAQTATLRHLLRSLPVPAEVLVEHIARNAQPVSKLPEKEPAFL